MDLNKNAVAIRKSIVEMIFHSQSGHPGGSLSIVQLLNYLYGKEMNVSAANPKDAGRDRFVLSKGHASPAVYATLAEYGFFDKDLLPTFRKIESPLQGHPDSKKVPGVDVSTGSLGQGVSNAVGLALGGKMDNSGTRVYTILGDGELQEGLVWEAAMAAAHYKLDNLVVMVDNNGMQIDGLNDDVVGLGDIAAKFTAFGFNVLSIDAHDYGQIESAFHAAREHKGAPTAIIAKSVKGRGVSFMENQPGWHGIAPNKEQLDAAIAELEAL